ncbi:MAG: DUF1211 domain-containing protein [Opitutaceae bacterium]|nr:DUF1211 domain-containing protein [Opitutaceae bacterium]
MPPRHEPYFRWRGRAVSRIEALADAVFAFAVTLLVVALEVPRTFDGLMNAIRGFPAFTVCFILLMIFWNAHYRFFRRYGLEDRFTRFTSIAILLFVLFCVYPLKFLFGAILQFGATNTPHIETLAQLKIIYEVYGLAFICIWALYAALYFHALKLRDVLGLNQAEVLQTREPLIGFMLNILVCLLSISLAQFAVPTGLPGFAYILLGPLLGLNGMWHGRQVRALAHNQIPQQDNRRHAERGQM